MKGSDYMKNLIKSVGAAVVVITTLYVVLNAFNQSNEYVGDYDID